MFTILQIHSGEAVKCDATDPDGIAGADPALFETEDAAWDYLAKRFGETAGREYVVVDVDAIQ